MMQIDTASILALAIIVALIFLGWRGRTGGDRHILREHSKLKSRLTSVEEALKSCATKADIAAVSGKIDALEEYAASAGDINALEGKINVIGERVDGVKGVALDTRESVKVIERLLMKGALDR